MSDTPRQLGRYELIRKIAAGGMGEIYLARTSGTAGFEKTVIIKTILPHLAQEETFVDKFLDEGRIVVNLTHGNIVPVFDMDEVDGEYYIAMEYVPGRDLRDVLGTLRECDERMPIDLAAYVASEICQGLGYAHRKADDDGEPLGIVHRDVSPSNVLLSTEGEVKLIDFGIAKAADRRAKTLSGQLQGKCCYMSPEQARGESLDARSDIFSTGVVLYEMLTGKRPFESDSDLRSLELVRQCEFERPSEHRPDIPDAIAAVVERALAENREERYQTIDAMQIDLMEYLYAQGRALTDQRVADYLREVYPDGPEREAFQEARRSSTTEAETEASGLGLDEALEREFEQLEAGASAPSDDNRESMPPLDESVASRDLDALGRTETLTPEASATPERASPDAESTESAETPPPDGVSSSTPSESSDAREHSRAPTAESDERPENADDAGHESSPDVTASNEEASSSPAREDDDQGAVESSSNSESTAPDSGPTEQAENASSIRIWGIALLVGLAIGAGLYGWVAPGSSQGHIHLDTQPQGARIMVDGVTLAGRTTPQTLRLEPGRHRLALETEGYPPERLDVDVASGERRSLSIEFDKSPPETERIPVEVEPDRATLRVDGRKRGAPPISVELAPDESKLVEARDDQCETVRRLVSYDEVGESVRLTLECSSRDTGPGTNKDAPDDVRDGASDRRESRAVDPAAPPPKRSIRFVSEPSGVRVVVDGTVMGRTPTSATFARDATLEIEWRKEGYHPVEQNVSTHEVSGGELEQRLDPRETGCLDFFAVYPSYNRIAIDGKWLDKRRQKLDGYELSTGSHTIRVQNPDAGRDETFEFEIEPGDDCTSLTVWDPDEDTE